MSNAITKTDVIDLSVLNPQESSFSPSEIKQIIYRRWKPALAVGITAFAAIFISNILKTPEYRSETLILLENSKTSESAPISPDESATSRFYSIKDLSTEIYVLRSNSMIEKAVDSLKGRYPDLSVPQVLKDLSIYQAAVDKIPTDVLVVSYQDEDPERAKAVLEALGSTYVDYSLEKQRLQAANAIKFINKQLPKAKEELDEAARAIRRFRQVNQIVDPETSAVAATEVKKTLAEQIQETQIAIDLNKRQTQWLENQLAELGQNSETMVASSILGQDGVYQNLARQLKDLETQYNLGQVDFYDHYPVMENLKDKREELKELLQERAEQVLGKSVSPTVLDQVVLTQGSSTTSSNNSEGAANNADSEGSEISSEGSTLQTFTAQKLELQNELAGLETKLAGLQQIANSADKTFQNIPGLQQTFTELQRQVGLKSEAYNYLLGRRQELEISEAEESAPWRVLNAPFLPSKPVSPNIQQGFLQALMAGGFLGIATAFLLQQLDQRVKHVEEIKQVTKLPLLGVIPKVDEPRIDINIHTTKRSYSYYSSFTEGLRSLAMNLRYVMTESGRIKTLALTSSTSAEGKSTISHNLGIVLAEFGLRVLLVDADMRKPKIHKLAKVDNETGLSDAITKDQPWTDFVRVGSVENLDIITAGNTSPNPIALLNSDKMKQLIAEWEEAYDYVIMDTPPIGVIADAKSLANQIDSILFVCGIQRANRKSIGNALDILRNSRCDLSGVVANLVDPDFDYYAYSYYDSYYNRSNENGSDDNSHNGNHLEGRMQNLLQQFRRR